MRKRTGDEEWTTIIKAKGRLFDIRFREFVKSKELIAVLVKRDFVTVYKQTILGPLWFIIQPLLTTMMYSFVFGNIAKMSTSGIPQPLFYFSGTMLWTFFSVNLIKCSDTFIANAPLFGKIYFPRLAIPLSYVTTNLITFGIQFFVFLILLAGYAMKGITYSLSPSILLLPLLIIQTAMLAVGVGMIISALTTKYRDLRNLVSFGVSLWMYATPVVYPLAQVPKRFLGLYAINPVAPVMEAFRFSLLHIGSFNVRTWGISLVVSFALFLVGVVVFNRSARNFVDVI